MPYVPEEDRERAARYPRTPGELNYAITKLLTWYLGVKGENYTHLQDCVAACECAKLELYRRVAAPYEDKKCSENGDVYDASAV